MARTLQPWSCFQPLEEFRREIDDLFSRFAGGHGRRAGISPPLPLVESFLEGNEYVIRLDLPGIDPKDLEVTVMNDVATVRGSREHHEKKQDLDFIHCEVSHGDFERTVSIPQGIRAEDIKAAYHQGVLELRMPAPKETAGRKCLFRSRLQKLAIPDPRVTGN
jgi:HSP20 family protein